MGKKKNKKPAKPATKTQYKLVKFVTLFIFLPILCTTLFEVGKTLYYKKYPLEFVPSKLTVDSEESQRYRLDILNRSDSLLRGSFIGIEFNDLRNEEKNLHYITLVPLQIKHTINPYIDSRLCLIGSSSDGDLQYSIIPDEILPHDKLTYYIEFTNKVYEDKIHIKSLLEFGYSIGNMHYSYNPHKYNDEKKK